MQKRTGALVPAAATAIGIAVSSFLLLPWAAGIIAIILGIMVYIILMRLSGDPISAYRLNSFHWIWIWLVFTGTGALTESLHRAKTIEEAYGNIPSSLSGSVKSIQQKTYGDKMEIEIDKTNGARCIVSTGATLLRPGDKVMFPSAKLRLIENDTSEYWRRHAFTLRTKGIIYHGHIGNKDLDFVSQGMTFESFFTGIREKIETKTDRSGLKKATSSFVNAILMGDKSGIDEETRMTFAEGGTAHMLALSGLHMGILSGLLLMLIWPLKAAGHYKWGYAAVTALLWVYVGVTGLSPSSVRACLMLTFAFTAIILERKNSVGHSLCSACLIMLILSPSTLFDAGFQLSVTCVSALVVFAQRLNPMRHRQHPHLYRVCEAILTTLVATGASWALTSYYFGQIPLMFLPTNLVLLPMLPLYLAMAVIYVTFLCFGMELSPIGWTLDRGYDFMIWATDTLIGGAATVISCHIPIQALAGWYLFLIIAGCMMARLNPNPD